MHRRSDSEPEAMLGVYVGLCWLILGHLGAMLAPSWLQLGHLGPILALSWASFTPNWPSWADLGPAGGVKNIDFPNVFLMFFANSVF